ncbi:Malto-oligosyltrehalose trehalohydrolase [Blastochloris viridis]|nr:Malto-oligosyltrehalose trehalohydrolase [Blastochloris viridis]
MPLGAELVPGGVDVRVWAPRPSAITLVMGGTELPLIDDGNGYRWALAPFGRAGSRYGFRIDGDAKILPDPASRWQPNGPHGLSAVVDPTAFGWHDHDWRGVTAADRVVYELHLGTFTAEGTFRAAIDKLPLLAEVGVTVIELMPVAEFPGRFGWGYDGVNLFAPFHRYGTPDDLRALVDAAHGLGLAVILDVVYNHLGPDGNYLPLFSAGYFTDRYDNEWGDAVNFDGEGSAEVRTFVCANAAYWVREFHFDGLRLDATQQIFDASPRNIIAELAAAAREAGGGRTVFVVAENEPQDATLVRPEAAGGYGVDAIWNEDFHHAARVALTGVREGYYSDYAGSARELLACVRHGFLYQGQRSTWQSNPRGAPALDLAPHARVNFLENHDQVANSATGARLARLTDARKLRAMTALALLAPGTPMLFQGQEFFATTPFRYFADHVPELAAATAAGRRAFLTQFPSTVGIALDPPHAEATFRASVLDWAERARNAAAVRLHRDLLELRRTDAVLSRPLALDGATLTEHALLVRFTGEREERLALFNFGADLAPQVVPEPLLAPPAGGPWRLLWSSEDPAYGGGGSRPPVEADGVWFIQGHAAAVLTAPR